MKKILIFIAIAIFAFASCSKDDMNLIPSFPPSPTDTTAVDTTGRDTTSGDTIPVDTTATDTTSQDTIVPPPVDDKTNEVANAWYKLGNISSTGYVGILNQYFAKGIFSGLKWEDIISRIFSGGASSKSRAAHAPSLSSKYSHCKMEYRTVDEKGDSLVVSAVMIWPTGGEIDEVVLCNHGTDTGNMGVPSDGGMPEVLFAFTNALTIFPDYIGFGSSKSHKDLYLNADISGRTTIDALKAGVKAGLDKGIITQGKFKSYVIGYSQGGAVSLSTLRRYQQLNAPTQEALNIRKVTCGDGPYDLASTFRFYKTQTTMMMPFVVPKVINGMMNSYGSKLGGYAYKDYFTQKFWDSGMPEEVRTLSYQMSMEGATTGSDLSLKDMLSTQCLTETSAMHKKLMDAMEEQNLTVGWKPQRKVLFLHSTVDTVVPYDNLETALKNFGTDNIETITGNFDSKQMTDHMGGMMKMITEVLVNKCYRE